MFQSLLDRVCNIQSVTKTQSTSGAVTDSWSNIATSVPTRFRKNKDAFGDGKFQVTTEDYKMSFMPTVTIAVGHRIVFENENYSVISVKEDSSRHHKTAYVRKIVFD